MQVQTTVTPFADNFATASKSFAKVDMRLPEGLRRLSLVGCAWDLAFQRLRGRLGSGSVVQFPPSTV